MNGVLLRVGFTFKTSLDSRRGFLIMFIPNLPRLVMIGSLIISLKSEEVLIQQERIKLLESVVGTIW